MSALKNVLLLGASGSIGTQTLDILDENKDKFVLTAFSVGKKHEFVKELLQKYKTVKEVYLIDKDLAKQYKKEFPDVKFYSGNKGLQNLTLNAEYDICVDALVGFVGFEPALIALKRNKILCLANKEALVVGGTLINEELEKGHGKLYPIDSEHVALAKCLANCKREDVKSLIITASGGALRNVAIDKLDECKATDALKHPTWVMGNKITIDCATMMNKGFEIIEAFYLYHFPVDKIQVIMHDESFIHSMVELNDGSFIAEFSKPDMHNPIKWALFEGKDNDKDIIRFKALSELKECHFHDYDPKRYPCTELAKSALKEGASKLIVLNASNEVLVNKYLRDEISFLDIAKNVEKVLKNVQINTSPTVKQIKKLDLWARREVK